MADTSNYSGFRYLMDAENSRQYAVLFDHGKPTTPIHIFTADRKPAAFKPGEVVFALDDEMNVTKGTPPDGRGLFVETLAWRIEADATAEHFSVEFAPVVYEIEAQRGAGISIKYKMTAQSVQDLYNGLDPRFPMEFERKLQPGEELAHTIFPPHHRTAKADVARQAIKALFPSGLGSAFAKAADSGAPKNYKVPDTELEALISKYCRDLSAMAAEGKLDPVIGRDEEAERAMKVLTRRKQSSLCFTGDAGVGKTAMFSAIAQRINDDATLPESLKGGRVLELDLQAMNAGAKFRGQFEEKLEPLIKGLMERDGILKGRKIIIAIDEIHMQLSAGKAEGGADAGNMMKPFLTARGISVMGTTTDEEYKKHIEKDPALGRRFEKLRLGSPDTESTVAIVKKLWPMVKEYNHLTEDLTDEQVRYIVTMTNRYAPQEAQPSKSEKVMNMAAASAEFSHRTAISKDDIISAVAQMSNLPSDFLSQGDHERFLKLEQELPKEVLGQPGLQRVVDGLIGSRSGLNDPNQPWGCFVFQGPTGTGKTEACKALARYLFGTEDALIKLDMSEYGEKHTVSRLIGAPPGYVGFDSAEPALTEKIRQRPYSILLLDEIEKAHPDVFNVLLPLLNDGKMTDNQGKTVLFNNVIVVMTSNAGAAEATKYLEGKSGMSFSGGQEERTPEKMKADLDKIYEKARKADTGGLFRPEMINRIEELGGFVTFLPLTQDVINKLVTREVRKINERLNSAAGANMAGVTLELSGNAMQQLAKEGYNPSMGARPLRKVVREKVANPLGKWMMANKESVLAFVAKEGGAKIVLNSLDTFNPEMAKAEMAPVAAAVANDNAGAPPAARKKKAGRPSGP